MQKSNLMQGSDAVLNAKAPVLVPLAPKSGITTITGVAPVAPPVAVAPPVLFIRLQWLIYSYRPLLVLKMKL